MFLGSAHKQHHSFDDPAAFDGSEEQRLELYRVVRTDCVPIWRALRKERASFVTRKTTARTALIPDVTILPDRQQLIETTGGSGTGWRGAAPT